MGYMVALFIILHVLQVSSLGTFSFSIVVILEHANQSRTAITALILGFSPANERRRYKVTPSLTGWAQT